MEESLCQQLERMRERLGDYPGRFSAFYTEWGRALNEEANRYGHSRLDWRIPTLSLPLTAAVADLSDSVPRTLDSLLRYYCTPGRQP